MQRVESDGQSVDQRLLGADRQRNVDIRGAIRNARRRGRRLGGAPASAVPAQERDLPHRGKVTIVGGIEDFPQRIEEGALSGSLVDDLLDCHLSPDFALDRDGTVDRHGLLAVQKLLPVDPIFGFALPKAGVSENNRQGRKRHEAFLVNEGQVTVRSEEHTYELQSLMRISYAV